MVYHYEIYKKDLYNKLYTQFISRESEGFFCFFFVNDRQPCTEDNESKVANLTAFNFF